MCSLCRRIQILDVCSLSQKKKLYTGLVLAPYTKLRTSANFIYSCDLLSNGVRLFAKFSKMFGYYVHKIKVVSRAIIF